MRGYDTNPPPGVAFRKFAVVGPLAGRALGVAGVAKDAAAAIIFFTTGPFNLEIDCSGPKGVSLAGLQRRVTAIALDQLSRLETERADRQLWRSPSGA